MIAWKDKWTCRGSSGSVVIRLLGGGCVQLWNGLISQQEEETMVCTLMTRVEFFFITM